MPKREPSVLLLASHPCRECLIGKRRVVPGSRAAELIEKVKREDRHFVCHKGSIAGGLNLHCRGVHDRWPSRAYRFAVAFGIEVREIDPDELAGPQ